MTGHNTPEANEAFRKTWDETNARWRAQKQQGVAAAQHLTEGRLTDVRHSVTIKILAIPLVPIANRSTEK